MTRTTPENHTEDSTTGWLGAHWGWNDVGNSEPGLYKVDLETCSVTTYWAMELAPFSMVWMK